VSKAWALARTTPALRGRVSMITQWAGQGAPEPARPLRQAAWSRHVQPPCAEAIAVGRQHVWTSPHVPLSPATADRVDMPSARLHRLPETLCHAACMDNVELRAYPNRLFFRYPMGKNFSTPGA